MSTSNSNNKQFTILPSLWFSHSLPDTEDSGDCDCDCEIACASGTSETEVASLMAPHITYENNIFQVASQLYRKNLPEGRQLVSNPIENGNLAILNRDAVNLFDSFQYPVTLNQPRENLAEWPAEAIDQTIIQLVKLGFLKSLKGSIFGREWIKPRVLTAWLHITNECNLRCPYCYLNKSPDKMSSDTAIHSVDAIFRSAALHDFQKVKLKYAGGEATLNFHHILAVHDYATNLGRELGIELEAMILSNGVSISERMIKEAARRRIHIMISLDGIGGHHDAQRMFANGIGSFQYVDRSITRLLNHGLIPKISVTVSRRNLDGLATLLMYLIDRDLPFSLNYYRENDCSAEFEGLRFDQKLMIDAMKDAFKVIESNLPRRSLLGCLADRGNLSSPHQHTCGVGQNYMVIDQAGNVSKCQMDIQNPLTTIKDEDVLQVIQNDRKGIQNLPVDKKEGCKSCEWRYWCAGGCSLLTYRTTGRVDIKSPNCDIYKALYPEILHLEALRLLKYETPWTPAIN